MFAPDAGLYVAVHDESCGGADRRWVFANMPPTGPAAGLRRLHMNVFAGQVDVLRDPMHSSARGKALQAERTLAGERCYLPASDTTLRPDGSILRTLATALCKRVQSLLLDNAADSLVIVADDPAWLETGLPFNRIDRLEAVNVELDARLRRLRDLAIAFRSGAGCVHSTRAPSCGRSPPRVTPQDWSTPLGRALGSPRRSYGGGGGPGSGAGAGVGAGGPSLESQAARASPASARQGADCTTSTRCRSSVAA